MGSKKNKQSDQFAGDMRAAADQAKAAVNDINHEFSKLVQNEALARYNAVTQPNVDIKRWADGAHYLTPMAQAREAQRQVFMDGPASPAMDAQAVAMDASNRYNNARQLQETVRNEFLTNKDRYMSAGYGAEGNILGAYGKRADILGGLANAYGNAAGGTKAQSTAGQWGATAAKAALLI